MRIDSPFQSDSHGDVNGPRLSNESNGVQPRCKQVVEGREVAAERAAKGMYRGNGEEEQAAQDEGGVAAGETEEQAVHAGFHLRPRQNEH